MKQQNQNNSFEIWLESVSGRMPTQTVMNKSYKLKLLLNIVMVFLILVAVSFSLKLIEHKILNGELIEPTIYEVKASDMEIDFERLDLPASIREEINNGYIDTKESCCFFPDDEKISFFSILRSILGIKTVKAAEVLNPNYSAIKMIQSERDTIEIFAGNEKEITVAFKNTGTKTWQINGNAFVSLYASSPSSRISPFEHPEWQKNDSYSRLTRLKNNWVRPGNLAFFSFKLKAPETAGTYTETYKLAVEDYCWINGSEISLNIKVIPRPASVASIYDPIPSTSTATPRITAPFITRALERIEEPTIRVGLHSAPEMVHISSVKAYEVVDTSGQTFYNRQADAETTIIYDRVNNKYILQAGGVQKVTRQPVRLVGGEDNQIFTITNYERRLGDKNFNQYRGIIEFRYNQASDQVWLINELKMEDYLLGIDETSDDSPSEFQKALIVAARTYALHHWERGTKHASDNFTVDALNDQIYRGVIAEQNHPSMIAAVKATRGIVVTYNNEPVITPYFSQSDGRTRDWQEVWGGGPYPWLVSVPDPYNNGKELLGHGVGLSAQGALRMASRDNKNFVEILQYYYKSTDVQQIYD